ncbi:MAG: hypothetical protein HY794_01040 [Desulfarculus sp.]|nr:hypothetical protein [Desulfarculus sp.]
MSTPSPPPRRLYPEHWLILAVVAAIMSLSLGWGLPDRERLELLNWGQPPTPQEFTRVFSAREAYYQTLDALQAQAGRQVLQGQPAPLGDPVNLTAVLNQAEKDTAWRSYVLGSAAVDERYAFSVLSRMNPATLDFNPRRHNYGGSFIYPLGGLLYLQKALGLLHITPELAYYVEHPEQVARMYRTGRLMSVLSLLGGLLLLGLLGNRLGGRAAATLAMLAYGCSSVGFWQALVTKPHLYAACLSFLGLYLLVRFQEEEHLNLLILSAAACGWAMGASLPAGALGLAYPILLYTPGGWRWLGHTCLAGLVMLAVYLLTNPYVLISPETFAYTLTLHSSGRGFGYGVFGLLKMQEYLHDIFFKAYAFPLGLLGGLAALGLAIRGQGLERRLAILFIALTRRHLGPGLAGAHPAMGGIGGAHPPDQPGGLWPARPHQPAALPLFAQPPGGPLPIQGRQPGSGIRDPGQLPGRPPFLANPPPGRPVPPGGHPGPPVLLGVAGRLAPPQRAPPGGLGLQAPALTHLPSRPAPLYSLLIRWDIGETFLESGA